MAWVTPITWTSSLVTVAQFNEQIRDNLNALKAPPTDLYNVNEGADYTTTSTSFVDVDSTDLALTITTTGGDVLITFYAFSSITASGIIFFDVHESVGNARLGTNDGMQRTIGAEIAAQPVCFVFLAQSLAAGSHTFKLQWKVSAGTATMAAGAGTSNQDVHPQFMVREI